MPVEGFRFAICNEIYAGAPISEISRDARCLGYEGLELAPHTLAEDATLLSRTERVRIRGDIHEAGLEFVGLHWLLVSPPGLKATSTDPVTRRRTWDYIDRCIALCADLAQQNSTGGGVIVLGSPKQRSTGDGVPAETGIEILTEELARAGHLAEQRGVTLLIEAIRSSETNIVNTLAEAVSVVQRAGSPAVRTMFDVHNAADETQPHSKLLNRFLPFIRHVHVNEMNGGEPGTGNYDFPELMAALQTGGYSGWISVESFDFSRSGHEIARRSIERLKTSLPASILHS